MIYFVLFVHFVSDFILQTDAMANGKSSSNKWLSLHIAAYSAPFLLLGWRYTAVNGLTHFAIDYCTSRWSSRMWKRGWVHEFFIVIGFDQFLHTAILILTLPLASLWWFP